MIISGSVATAPVSLATISQTSARRGRNNEGTCGSKLGVARGRWRILWQDIVLVKCNCDIIYDIDGEEDAAVVLGVS